MAEILIREVPEDVIAAIDEKAQHLGLSRSEFLRRASARESDARMAYRQVCTREAVRQPSSPTSRHNQSND